MWWCWTEKRFSFTNLCVFRTMSWHWNISRRQQSRAGWTGNSSWEPCITVSVVHINRHLCIYVVCKHLTPSLWSEIFLICAFLSSSISFESLIYFYFLFIGLFLFIHCYWYYFLFFFVQMVSVWSGITNRHSSFSTWHHRLVTSWPSTIWHKCMPPAPVWCAPVTLLWR